MPAQALGLHVESLVVTISRRDVSTTGNGDATLFSDIILRRKGA